MTAPRSKNADPDVRVDVRAHYGKIASEFSGQDAASCCGPGGSVTASFASQLYQTPDVDRLPADVTGLSLGCGDPVTVASLQEGQTVLDLGSGGGIDCFLAARQVGDAGKVIGVDMTSEMIEKARANRSKLGSGNVEFRLGEIEHLPVANGEVDVVISNCVINLSPDKHQVFREAFRALRPGGLLSVTDIVANGPLPDSVTNDPEMWSCCVSGASDAEDYVSAIVKAGFVDVQLAPVRMEEAVLDDVAGVSELAAEWHPVAVNLESGPARLVDLGVDVLADSRPLIYSARVTARKPEIAG